jgi:hypothetical protein
LINNFNKEKLELEQWLAGDQADKVLRKLRKEER